MEPSVAADLAGTAPGSRKLIAIMHADVVGYSRLIGLDDAGTLERLRVLRRDLIDPANAEFGGRVVQTAGDSWLVVFDSIDGALRCAMKVQQELPSLDGTGPGEQRIRLRIGVNIGDVIPDRGDLHGDGVNITVRLQEACPVGGICVTRVVRDHVQDRLHLEFEPLGELRLKNIARSVEAFVLRFDPVLARRGRAGAWVAGAVILAAILAAGGWWTLRDRTPPPVMAAVAPAAARPAAYSPQDRRYSVIVLPFENTSGDPAQDGIAAGIARDVTELIGQDHTNPLVPAANDAAYRGKAPDLRAIGRDHDVHFALTGNARRHDGHLIVAATVFDTADERSVWSQRFDRPDGPDAWDSIVRTIVAAGIDNAINDAEAARAMREHPDSLDKRDLIAIASATPLSQVSKENLLARIALCERALALDPNYVVALSDVGFLRANLVRNGFSSDPAADLASATAAVDRALVLSPTDLSTLTAKAEVARAQGDLDGAAAVLRKLIELRPQYGWDRNALGVILMAQGHYKEALENFIIASQLTVGIGPTAIIDANIALGLLANDRFPEAIAQARLAISESPPQSGFLAENPWLALIAAESENGQDAEARADLQKFLAAPRRRRTMAEIKKASFLAGNAKLLEGLRRAGMPTE